MAVRSRIQRAPMTEEELHSEIPTTLAFQPPSQIVERAEPTKSCGPNDKTGACERTGGNSNLIPIILGAG